MEYNKVEEDAIYRTACENLKSIANAIKAIRIKYYPNFSKISDEDKKTYEELQSKMSQISGEHGLDKLRVELIGEITKKYENQSEEEQGRKKTEDDFLLACYGAIDAEVAALSSGKLKQAMRCQATLKQYTKAQNDPKILSRVTIYKRGKFEELSKAKENIQKQVIEWTDKLRSFNARTPVAKKQESIQILGELKKDKEPVQTKQQNEQEEELAY